MKTTKPDIIIPVSLEADWVTVESVVSSIMEQNRLFGFTRFALAMPSKGWRSISYPPEKFFAERANMFLEIRKRLPENIRCGWWHTLVLKSGPTPGFSRIVREDGTEAPISTCPLDPEYRARFARDVAAVVKICKPDFLLTEDDFGMNCHGGSGCYCRRHLEAFAEREGHHYNREELQKRFTEAREENRDLLRRFQLLQRDSLVLFAQAIRKAVDEVYPEMSIGYDQPGCSARDGDSVEAVARALAGKNHTPWVRFCGANYGEDCISRIPELLFACLYYRQHIPGKFGFYHESDSYPHTRFFISASCMRVYMSTVYSYGYIGSVFQTQQIMDDPNEEKAYGKMFAEERPRFRALMEKTAGCRVRGVQLLHNPFYTANFPKQSAAWLSALSGMGIPHTTEEEETVFLSGNQLLFADDKTIMKYLSKGLFLDGLAAKVLCDRGYESYLGVNVTFPLIAGNGKYDLEAREIIDPDFIPSCKGRHMHRGDVYSPYGNGSVYKLEITDPNCEKITEIVTSQKEPMAPGMTRFRNKLGGRVIVYATEVNGNRSSSLFNYRRQKLLQELLLWCSDSIPFVRNEPRINLIVNEAPAGSDCMGVLTCINLSPDPLDKLALHLPPVWRENIVWKTMDREGFWHEASVQQTEDGIILEHPLFYTDPVYVLAERKQ